MSQGILSTIVVPTTSRRDQSHRVNWPFLLQNLVAGTKIVAKMASSHDATSPCDLLQGLVPSCVPTLKFQAKQISPTFSYFLINNVLLYHFLVNLLAHNKKRTEKSVFHEVQSPKMTSQSFCTPPEVKSHVFAMSKHGKGKLLSKFFLLFLSIHCGDSLEEKNLLCTL